MVDFFKSLTKCQKCKRFFNKISPCSDPDCGFIGASLPVSTSNKKKVKQQDPSHEISQEFKAESKPTKPPKARNRKLKTELEESYWQEILCILNSDGYVNKARAIGTKLGISQAQIRTCWRHWLADRRVEIIRTKDFAYLVPPGNPYQLSTEGSRLIAPQIYSQTAKVCSCACPKCGCYGQKKGSRNRIQRYICQGCQSCFIA